MWGYSFRTRKHKSLGQDYINLANYRKHLNIFVYSRLSQQSVRLYNRILYLHKSNSTGNNRIHSVVALVPRLHWLPRGKPRWRPRWFWTRSRSNLQPLSPWPELHPRLWTLGQLQDLTLPSDPPEFYYHLPSPSLYQWVGPTHETWWVSAIKDEACPWISPLLSSCTFPSPPTRPSWHSRSWLARPRRRRWRPRRCRGRRGAARAHSPPGPPCRWSWRRGQI